MITVRCLLIALLSFGGVSTAAPSPLSVASDGRPVVDLGYAKYRGHRNDISGYNTFFTMRFAAPAVGNLRFRKPQDPPQVNGIQDANDYGVTCPQAMYNGQPGVSFETQSKLNVTEDCLTLTVYSPIGATEESKLPVVVYLHGGGYSLGDHRFDHPQSYLELAKNDVVSVVINYRLGIFGFLAGEDVKRDGDLNAGLLDQEFALKWVQKYIHLFGGEKREVTLWGQSAGAGSVLQQVIARGGEAENLFIKAVANSPFLPPQYNYNDPIPTNLYERVIAQAGCANSANRLNCLRSKPFTVLRDANIIIASQSANGILTWRPVVDGCFIKQRPTVALEGKTNGKMLLTTHTKWEGAALADASVVSSNFTAFIKTIVPTATNSIVNKLVSLYPLSDYTNDFYRASSLYQDPIFVCPSYWLASSFAEKKRLTWKGVWDVLPGLHGQDAGYFFTAAPELLPSFTTFQNYVGAIVSFVRLGSPNRERLNALVNPEWPYWPKGVDELGKEKHFDVTAALVSFATVQEPDPKLMARCAYWKSIGAITGQ